MIYVSDLKNDITEFKAEFKEKVSNLKETLNDDNKNYKELLANLNEVVAAINLFKHNINELAQYDHAE